MNVWGTFDLTEEFVESMRRSLDFDYDYFINLSGQCYPTKSIKFINEFFNVNHGYSFIEHKKIPDYSLASDGRISRFRYKYYKVPFGELFRYRPFSGKRYDASIFASIQKLVNRKLFYGRRYDANLFAWTPRILNRDIEKLNLYGGSTWFFLRRKHVEYILDFINNNKEIVRFFRRVWAPDEHFFQTILAGEYSKGEIKNDNLRYVDWSTDGSETPPRTLRIKDFDKIVTSGKLFARKFDENVDKEILDKIDNDILIVTRTNNRLNMGGTPYPLTWCAPSSPSG